MVYTLSDIFIGDFPQIQSFGSKPEIYSARYNIRHHNGIDFGCPSLTMVLAASGGTIIDTGFDAGGYGNFIKIQHNGFLTLYAHLNDIAIKTGDQVVAGQLIGHSNNTGFSDTPHLHFGIAPIDEDGKKREKDNGCNGYIDPMGEECKWEIKHLTEPVNPQVITDPPILVDTKRLSEAETAANNFAQVITFCKQNGLPDLNPSDPVAGQKVNAWIAALHHENKIHGRYLQDTPEQKQEVKKNSFLSNIADFIFEKN